MRTYKNRKKSLRQKSKKERKSRKQRGGTGWGFAYPAPQNYWEEGVLAQPPSITFAPEQSYSPFYDWYPRFNQTGGMHPVNMPISYSNTIRTNNVRYFLICLICICEHVNILGELIKKNINKEKQND